MIRISTTTLHVTQDRDTCDDGPETQEIRIVTEDGGGGPYLVVSTDRWAMNLMDVPRLALAMVLVLGAGWISGFGE